MAGLNRKIKEEGGRWLGFSLIELMITISIMGILTATMIPALRSFDRKNKLGAASEQLKGAITEARNYSMAPRFGDTNPKIYAVRIKNLALSEYSIGYWDVDKATLNGLIGKSPATPDVCPPAPAVCADSWESHWKSISDRKYPSGVIIGSTAGDVCPNLDLDLTYENGPAKSSEFGIGFNVPDGSPIFDTKYNFSNKASDNGCTSVGVTATGWDATGASGADPVTGAGFIKITSRDDPNDYRTIYIHSYNGQITVK